VIPPRALDWMKPGGAWERGATEGNLKEIGDVDQLCQR